MDTNILFYKHNNQTLNIKKKLLNKLILNTIKTNNVYQIKSINCSP